MFKISALFLVVLSLSAFAENVFRIELGKDYSQYSNQDLKRRVWELERAVAQLQERVFSLEAGPKTTPVDTWVCHVTAMGEKYTGTGPSKAMASAKAAAECKSGRGGNSFHCSDPVCSQ